jgi:PAS domain S-box-containing protein
VTDSPRAPLDLAEQAELVELANDAIFVRAVNDATILSWNRGAEVLYGWTKDEAIGRVSHELLRTEFPRPLEEIEADLIRLAVNLYRGRMTEVARRLGIGRSTLYRKLGELGIDTAA